MSTKLPRKSIGPSELESLRIEYAALLYFIAVFAAGFLLGVVRVAWLEPRLGSRTAELLELPVMLLVIAAAATWIVRKVPIHQPIEWLTAGCLALGIMVLVEATLVMWLRGMSVNEYISSRDPVAGVAYIVGLIAFALFPAGVSWRSRPAS